jgi:hypothetical protein
LGIGIFRLQESGLKFSIGLEDVLDAGDVFPGRERHYAG